MRIFCFGLGYSARRLIARNPDLQASGVTRDGGTAKVLRQQGVEAYAFDPSRPHPDLLAALARAQVLLVSAPPGAAGDPAISALASEIVDAPHLERILYLSSIGVYGDRGGGWVDEESEPAPTSPRARERLAAEEEWRALGAARHTPVDVLRLSGIYGPGRNALIKLRSGAARRIVKPGQVFNRIHVDDIAEIARRLIARRGLGSIWNLADKEPTPPQDVIAYAAGLLGLPTPPDEPYGAAGLSPMARSFYEGNRRVSVEKLERDLGYRWLYPNYRAGLDALAAAGEGGQ